MRKAGWIILFSLAEGLTLGLLTAELIVDHRLSIIWLSASILVGIGDMAVVR